MSAPKFEMPACHRHFFKGHKWWCRACDVVTEVQFRDVAEAWWASQPMSLFPPGSTTGATIVADDSEVGYHVEYPEPAS